MQVSHPKTTIRLRDGVEENSGNFDNLVLFNVHSHRTVHGLLPFHLHYNVTVMREEGKSVSAKRRERDKERGI